MTYSLLEKLISKDYHIIGEGRWGSTEEHDSLVIDRKRDLFFWNSKEIYGNALDWLTRVKGFSFSDAIIFLKDEEKRYVIPTFTSQQEEEPAQEELVNIFWRDGKGNRSYWYDRKLTDITIDSFRLGYHNGWYTLPIFMDGRFRNFQMRRDQPRKRILNYHRGVGPLLINSDILQYVNKIVITEGPVDALLLTQEGLPAVSHNGGSHGWRIEWFKYFIGQKEIFYVADQDLAGIAGAKKVATCLGQWRVKILLFDDKPEKYDTVDYFREGGTIDKFKEILYNRSKYIFELG